LHEFEAYTTNTGVVDKKTQLFFQNFYIEFTSKTCCYTNIKLRDKISARTHSIKKTSLICYKYKKTKKLQRLIKLCFYVMRKEKTACKVVAQVFLRANR